MEARRVVLSDITCRYAEGGGAAPVALEVKHLAFEEGKCYLITGSCGSGKTTLALLLKGLLVPASGKLLLEHTDETLPEFQRGIGFCFQYPEAQFFNETVSGEISFGPTMLGQEHGAERIETSLRMVGISNPDIAACSPFELSFGEKRRVAIASIIACDPSWYIFDEPTAGLDPEGKRLLMDLTERLSGEKKTVLIITQELGLFSRLSDEIILLERGRLLARAHSEAFFEQAGIETITAGFPYHTRVLISLRKRGWDIPVSLLDPSEAAAAIAAMVR